MARQKQRAIEGGEPGELPAPPRDAPRAAEATPGGRRRRDPEARPGELREAAGDAPRPAGKAAAAEKPKRRGGPRGRRGETGRAYRKGPAVDDGLTERRRLFVAEYLANNGHATKAAIAAGYSERSAPVQAARIIREPAVAAAIEAGRAKVLSKLEVKAESVIAELAKVAFDEEVSPVKVRALELLGKHLQLFVERVDLKVDAMTPEERAARAAALIATARGRLLSAGDGEGSE